MSLPISTPPNAIAFATRAVATRDMARYGTLVSGVGLAVLLFAFLVLGRLIGRM
jgi:sodium-dependent dicarboxylate transporter 2/3/5